jgi:hypothetical protein
MEQLLTNALILLHHATVEKFSFDKVANGWRYRRLGRTKLENGKLP